MTGRATTQSFLLIQVQALLSVFKSRLGDVKEKDTAVERCEVSLQDRPDETECRMIVKMICRHGMQRF